MVYKRQIYNYFNVKAFSAMKTSDARRQIPDSRRICPLPVVNCPLPYALCSLSSVSINSPILHTMPSTYIKGIGFYVPENIVTNKDLERHMDTTDEWIQER